MIRSSILYRRLWYVKKRNARRIRIYIRLLAACLVLYVLATVVNCRLVPALDKISGNRVQTYMTSTIHEVVEEVFSDGIQYEDLVKCRKDQNGNIQSLELDTVKLNKLSSLLSGKLRERLEESDTHIIAIPAGCLVGGLLNDTGPTLKVRIRQYGNVETSFPPEYSTTADRKTGHRVCMRIKAEAEYDGPLVSGHCVVDMAVPIMEAIIPGNIREKNMERIALPGSPG